MATIYLSGPMRGRPFFNFPLFESVTAGLRKQGHLVHSPAEKDLQKYPNMHNWPGFESGDPHRCPMFNMPDALAWDFTRIIDSWTDGIALLPGWEESVGACAERFVAEMVGKKCWLIGENLGTEGGCELVLDDEKRCHTYVYKGVEHVRTDQG